MSGIQNLLHKQYLALISRWPVDPLRPNLSFADTLSYRISSYFGNASSAGDQLPTTGAATKGREGQPMRKFDEGVIKGEMNAVAALLEDRFKNAYPVSDRILKPKGNPEYYEKLMRELDEAPQRGWLSRNLNRWKGIIRMS